MEFTHQNLNKDFLTGDFGNSKKDQFADFMSIVDEKFQDQSKQNMKKEKKETQGNIKTSNTIYESQKIQKPENIKKI